MNPTIEELTAAVEREARKRPEALRLMTHPGVGALTALAYVLIIGRGYDVRLQDLTDKNCWYAALTDESGVIRQSKSIDCTI
jgi:transposase